MAKISGNSWIFVTFITMALIMFGAACSSSAMEQKSKSENAGHTYGEETYTHDQEEEESGEKLALTDTYDHVRNGVRLVMAFHNASSSFVGSVENVTDKTIKKVRVEVLLSSGAALGPTEPMDLAPGEKAGIKLEAKGHVFEWWKAHAESGSGAHTHLPE